PRLRKKGSESRRIAGPRALRALRRRQAWPRRRRRRISIRGVSRTARCRTGVVESSHGSGGSRLRRRRTRRPRQARGQAGRRKTESVKRETQQFDDKTIARARSHYLGRRLRILLEVEAQ